VAVVVEPTRTIELPHLRGWTWHYCRGMTRPLRLEFAGALYHVTSRGDRREAIYKDDFDRMAWLDVLGLVCARCNFVVHSFCQMTNHYHLLVETVDGNLARGMRQLNGTYTQYFNRRHKLVGHLFQGRYKAILVQKETYLLELTRYVVLNPLRAKMVSSLEDWEWSSYHYLVGRKLAPPWMAADWLLGQFGDTRSNAVAAYHRFVMQGHGLSSPLKDTKYQTMLGDATFIAQFQYAAAPDGILEVPKAQRRTLALTLPEYQSRYPDRDEAMARAYFSTAYTMAQIGKHFGVAYRTVSRAVQTIERKEKDAGIG
jgi:putative transposase